MVDCSVDSSPVQGEPMEVAGRMIRRPLDGIAA